MNWLLSLLLTVFSYSSFSQTTGSVNGKVFDAQTNEVLPGATVTIMGGNYSLVTNASGEFNLSNLAEGKVDLLFTYVGYEDLQLSVIVIANKTSQVLAALTLDQKKGSEVVVTATKHPEKIANVPASIQVIGIKDFQQSASYNVHEMLSKVQGIEFTRYGIDGITFNARGINSAFNNKILELVDGRNSMAALSANLPIYSLNAGTYNKEDLERIEIVMGPQSALYGPNAQNAVLNFISKDPGKYAGTTVAVNAGNHYQFSARFRHAAKINNKWAYKLTGEYSAGTEFFFYDSLRAGGGIFGDTVKIPEHNVNFNYRHLRGEMNVYYSVNPKTTIVVSAGGSNNNTLQVTTVGRNQMAGVTYGYVQAKLLTPHFYATLYNTWGNIGHSYSLTPYSIGFWNLTHKQPVPMPPDSAEAMARHLFKEASQRLNADLQYNYNFQKYGLFLVAGLNYQHERPNGYGVNLVDSFERINIFQYGAALQLEKTLPFNMEAIAAIRFDHHSNFGSFYAPKFALIKNLNSSSFRISWAKAYTMPNIQQQYAGIDRAYFGNGGSGIRYIPNETRPNNQASVKNTIPVVPEEVNTWEAGYRGGITEKFYVDITAYRSVSKNFVSPILAVGGRALSVNSIAVNPSIPGEEDSNGILHHALFFANFNSGTVKTYGIDAGLNYQFSKKIDLTLKYSWFNYDTHKDSVVSPIEKSLNTPHNRGVVILSFQNLCKERLYINISARYVEQYDFYSGNQQGTKEGEGKWGPENFDWGPLGGFTSFDLNAGYQVNKHVSMSVGISNIFNTKQIEMVGSPSIGRLIIAELKVDLPETKK